MTEKEKVLFLLKKLDIPYDIYHHPPLPTIEIAVEYWKSINATHCKNLFFRNHKGNRHYLVILKHDQALGIHDLEKRLRQGKISFASPKRMEKYLGVDAGSVSVFGLINDYENHVYVFIDENIRHSEKVSFHPNDNTSTVVISFADFIKFLDNSGNSYELITLY
ncbi:MAG: prolyl-tRNA synthetase associated domain-containing protein [Bacteroidales bacterium]|nr:prolyl-tRNA synthetase associated domain-containing protein [Bacteroidales bacterium]MBN2697803.1 prolyl-tRNA synthetase associated domain-containing protein [Bacteroidales bacterium]